MSAAVLIHLVRERIAWRPQPRVPEPDLVMESVAQATSFSQAGDTGGVLAFLYLYNTLQVTTVLRPGDRVLDLACGPANQLAQIAGFNPEVHFVGLDASPTMLECAQNTLARANIDNVELRHGDMTHLVGLEDGSMDCVISTMSLHHLQDQMALCATVREVRRVLKPQGRVYMVDFGRLKRQSTQRFFADDLGQSAQFTEDYFNSLRAAFSVEELSAAVAPLGSDIRRHVTVLAPFLIVFRSAFQRPIDAKTLQRAKAAFAKLPPALQDNFRNVARWFRISGYALPYNLD
jgi:ubiquinone/menaquinone biosynthesis C-methylase UbiE